jgi:hypothetical protein
MAKIIQSSRKTTESCFFFFFAPKRDKPESNRHAIPSPGADFCRIAVMGESQIQDIVAKVLFFREY